MSEATATSTFKNCARPFRPIRIAYVIDDLGMAGTEQWLLQLINEFDRGHVEPHLILLRGNDPTLRGWEPPGLPVLRLGLTTFRNPYATLVAAWTYLGYLRRQQIDAVQLHFKNSTLFAAPLSKVARIRHVWATSRNSGYWLQEKSRTLQRWVHRLVTGTIANSPASRKFAIEGLGLSAESVALIPNGIDLRRFRNAAAVRTQVEPLTPWQVGIVANLRPVKDLPTFIRAARHVVREIPTVQFLVAGEGPDRDSLMKLIEQLQLTNNLRLLGAVRDVPEFLRTLDVAVLSSKAEGLSNSLLEYMAAGRPVVATQVGGNLALVVPGKTGLLCPAEEPETMAAAILQLLRDRDLARRLGQSASDMVRSCYSLDAESTAYLKFYRSHVWADCPKPPCEAACGP